MLFAALRGVYSTPPRKVLLLVVIPLDIFLVFLLFAFLCPGLLIGLFVALFFFRTLYMLFPKVFLFLMTLSPTLFLLPQSLELHWQKAGFLKFCKIEQCLLIVTKRPEPQCLKTTALFAVWGQQWTWYVKI